MNLMYDYICERYAGVFPDMYWAAVEYVNYLQERNITQLIRPYGFITYKFEGDACIIYDLYTSKEYRKTKQAWTLWTEMLQIIQQNPLCKVVIGFSEYAGKGHQDGIGAMKAAGFVKAYDLTDRSVYIRGTQ